MIKQFSTCFYSAVVKYAVWYIGAFLWWLKASLYEAIISFKLEELNGDSKRTEGQNVAASEDACDGYKIEDIFVRK